RASGRSPDAEDAAHELRRPARVHRRLDPDREDVAARLEAARGELDHAALRLDLARGGEERLRTALRQCFRDLRAARAGLEDPGLEGRLLTGAGDEAPARGAPRPRAREVAPVDRRQDDLRRVDPGRGRARAVAVRLRDRMLNGSVRGSLRAVDAL